MGCRIASDGTTLHIEGVGAERLGRCTKIETGESGLLTRLLTPLASHISALNGGAPVEISGHGSILKRNLHEAVAALREAGVHCSAREEGYLPFRIEGGITRREIAFSGRESSQTVSGFLMTLPLLQDATVLTVTEPSSIPYLELTLRTLTRFGIRLDREAFYDGGAADGSPGRLRKSSFRYRAGRSTVLRTSSWMLIGVRPPISRWPEPSLRRWGGPRELRCAICGSIRCRPMKRYSTSCVRAVPM